MLTDMFMDLNATYAQKKSRHHSGVDSAHVRTCLLKIHQPPLWGHDHYGHGIPSAFQQSSVQVDCFSEINGLEAPIACLRSLFLIVQGPYIPRDFTLPPHLLGSGSHLKIHQFSSLSPKQQKPGKQLPSLPKNTKNRHQNH